MDSNVASLVVSIVLIVFGFTFGFIALMRYLAYKETLALAEKGLVRPQRSNGGGNDMLRWGVIITALGLSFCIGLYPIGFIIGSFGERLPWHFGPWMLVGIIPTFFGLGLILIHVLTRESHQASDTAARNVEPPTE